MNESLDLFDIILLQYDRLSPQELSFLLLQVKVYCKDADQEGDDDMCANNGRTNRRYRYQPWRFAAEIRPHKIIGKLQLIRYVMLTLNNFID